MDASRPSQRAAGTRRALIGSIGILAALLVFTPWATTAQAAPSGRKPDPVIFSNGSITLAGTLYLPTGHGRHPAVVVFHAADGGTRDFRAYQHLLTALPAAGFAVLIYDRRGSGASGGDFDTATYEDLARDGIAGIKLLQSRKEIDPSRIGAWGMSQGGWLAALASTLSSDVAFVVSVSGPGVGPARQMDYAAAYGLRDAGYPPEIVERAMQIRAIVNDYYRGRATRSDAETAIERARHEQWFSQILLPNSGNLPGDPKPTKWYAAMDYDPLEVLRRVRVPILFFFAETDRWVPVEESIVNIRRSVPTATITRIAGVDHYMQAGTPDSGGPTSKQYVNRLVEWLRKLSFRRLSGVDLPAGSGRRVHLHDRRPRPARKRQDSGSCRPARFPTTEWMTWLMLLSFHARISLRYSPSALVI